MNKPSLFWLRLSFILMSLILMLGVALSLPGSRIWERFLVLLLSTGAFGSLLMGTERLMRHASLRLFNLTLVGLFFGYLMGKGLLLIGDQLLILSGMDTLLQKQTVNFLKTSLQLIAVYVGILLTISSKEELYLSIPFIKFHPQSSLKKRELLLDASILMDGRIYDLASTGLFDHQLIVPKFVVKELSNLLETTDESVKARAKRGLEVLKKLEQLSHLNLKFHDQDYPELKDASAKLLQLAKHLEAALFSADGTKVAGTADAPVLISIQSLFSALKPLSNTGELLKVKIQRYGKEPNQGVGYLEDGTMIVVNGGGNFLGETIDVQVLSVKHSSTGRMIFCNALDHVAASS